MSVAVAYLARGIGAGLTAAEAFFESYQRHPAGYDHNLYVLSKGWPEAAEREKLADLAWSYGARVIELPDDGFDFAAYFRFAEEARETTLCFLNSHSQIRTDNWLKYLAQPLAEKDIGMLGCTGSLGTLVPVMGFILPIIKDVAAVRGLVVATLRMLVSYPANFLRYLIRIREFPAFPNPHVRSNAFLISAEVFGRFRAARSIPQTKSDAFKLESGHLSLSRFVAGEGLRCLVVDADGQPHEHAAWQKSQTFRTPGQPGLMITDNQTRSYDTGTVPQRRMMELSAWGVFLTER